METTDVPPPEVLFDPPPTGTPDLVVAGRFVAAVAARDFDAALDAVADDVAVRALLPRRVREVHGRTAFRALLDTWFAAAELWEPVDTGVDEIGGRLHLRWRVRVTKPSLGPGPHLVEQHAYADSGTDGRLANLAILCAGFLPEAS